MSGNGAWHDWLKCNPKCHATRSPTLGARRRLLFLLFALFCSCERKLSVPFIIPLAATDGAMHVIKAGDTQNDHDESRALKIRFNPAVCRLRLRFGPNDADSVFWHEICRNIQPPPDNLPDLPVVEGANAPVRQSHLFPSNRMSGFISLCRSFVNLPILHPRFQLCHCKSYLEAAARVLGQALLAMMRRTLGVFRTGA